MVIIAILVGLCAGAATFFLIDHFSVNRNLPTSQFKREQAKALQGLVEKKNALDKEFDDDLMRRHNERKQQFEQELKSQQEKFNLEVDFFEKQKEIMEKEYNRRSADMQLSYNKKNEMLEQGYEAKAKMLEEQATKAAQQRQEAMEKEITEEQKKLSFTLQKLQADYKDKEDELNKNFFQMSEQINQKKAELTKEIQEYEAKQNAIIARFKEDEEKKQQADFYRIKVNEIEKADIAKLKSLSTSFSKPECLYKVMYEVYYKARLEELFKRILGENKDKGGIYKITNINNQKVYIGKCVRFIDRWRTHAKRGCGIERISGQLYDAMFEDGLENYTWEIVEVCPKEEQTEKEKYWIKFYKSSEYGFNQRVG